MARRNHINNNDFDYYILSDQPTTCGGCGSRTSFEIRDDGTQKHRCLNIGCGYKFLTVED